MNTRLTPFLLLLALAHNVGAHDEGNKPQVSKNYLSYLSQLPEDSAVRKASKETTPRSRYWLFKDDKQLALEHLQGVFRLCRKIDEDGAIIGVDTRFDNADNIDIHPAYFILLANKKNIKVAIRTILQDNPDELKWQEYDHVLQLVQKLNAERKQQLEEEHRAHDKVNYLSQLPEGSALRKASETTPKLFKEQLALEHLQGVFKLCRKIDRDGVIKKAWDDDNSCVSLAIANNNSIKDAIRTILRNEPAKLKWQEFDHVINLVRQLSAERKQRIEGEKKRQREEDRKRQEEYLRLQKEDRKRQEKELLSHWSIRRRWSF